MSTTASELRLGRVLKAEPEKQNQLRVSVADCCYSRTSVLFIPPTRQSIIALCIRTFCSVFDTRMYLLVWSIRLENSKITQLICYNNTKQVQYGTCFLLVGTGRGGWVP